MLYIHLFFLHILLSSLHQVALIHLFNDCVIFHSTDSVMIDLPLALLRSIHFAFQFCLASFKHCDLCYNKYYYRYPKYF